MKVILPSYEILTKIDGTEILKQIEIAGRTCYKSEHKIGPDTYLAFAKKLIKSGHHSVIEHYSISVRFICDRGVSHELVRHRLASFSQESTRYANYSKNRFGKEITVINPYFWEEGSFFYNNWLETMKQCEEAYLLLIELGATPQEARSVLPNSLKTEVIMTANIREWRHVLDLRCSKGAHPQIRELMLPLLHDLNQQIPVLFEDIVNKYTNS